MRALTLTLALHLAVLGSCAAPPPVVPAVPETKRYLRDHGVEVRL